MYYLKSLEELVAELKVDSHEGLSWSEAEDRLKKFGPNEIPEKNKESFWRILISQFKDFMVLVLMVAGAVSAFMGHVDDSVTIMVIVVLNGLLGFIQEYRAEKSLQSLKKLTALKARVLRSGSINEIVASKLVPGDIMVLQMGDKLAADGRLFELEGLEIDESLITGESVPVKKTKEKLLEEKISFGDQTNMVFSGSYITRGHGRAIVTGTGKDTKVGAIAKLLEDASNTTTPLQKRLDHLGKWLVLICLLCCFLVVLLGVIKGESYYRMIMAGISLAVAAIPEGLPAIVTLSLALGVQRMIKRNAIIRKLPAVEALGCARVICADKTGTLTTNKMIVSQVYFAGEQWLPYQFKASQLKEFWETAAICNEALLSFTKGKISYLGDPTDGALLLAAYEAGIRRERLLEDFSQVKMLGFTSENKKMTVFCEKDGQETIFVKGAPEVIIDACFNLSTKEKEDLNRQVERMASKGLRVLALAKSKNWQNELVFLGLAGLKDPPKDNVKEAVRLCHQAGIKVIMITGDHKNTAKAIAKEVGILRRGRVWSGSDLPEEISPELLAEVEVVARVNPGDKLRIIKALQAEGEVVAMTGDGVNDAPAIKEADIGIAMGLRGTEVAKEAASLVLADDNFSTIVAAVEEGRVIYNNIRKFLRYLLSCNLGELLTVIVSILCGLPLPLLPIQMLWVNLVTDGLPALALGIEDASDSLIMEQEPRDSQESIFANGLATKIFVQGSLIGLITVVAYFTALRLGQLEWARSVAFTTLVVSQLFFVFSCSADSKPFWEVNIFKNIYLVLAVFTSLSMHIAILYWPLMQKIFMTCPLDLPAWLFILAISVLPILFWELGRNIYGNWGRVFKSRKAS